MPPTPSEKKSFFAEWLEKLQQESWQLELLISGFALFGIQKSRGAIFSFQEYLHFEYTSPILKLSFRVLEIGWKIFFFNLLVHVIFRGLWIGAIGLRYVSGEIDYDKLNYSPYFTKYLKKSVGDYDDFIEKLEKICSVIFSYTFLLFLFFVSLMTSAFFIYLPGFIYELFFGDLNSSPLAMLFFSLYAITYVLIGLIVFIDFISLGAFKRIKDDSVSRVYSWIYIFFSITSLTFLYRPLIYNFIDNKYTKPLFYLSFPYIFFILTFNNSFTINSFPHIPNEKELREQGILVNDFWYEDLAQAQIDKSPSYDEEIFLNSQLPSVVLSNYHMKDPYASIMMRFYHSDTEMLKESKGLTAIHKDGMAFSLFGEKLEEDSLREEVGSFYNKQMLAIAKVSRVMKDSMKRNRKVKIKKTYFKQQRDSLRNVFITIADQKKEALRRYDQKKNQKMLDAFVSLLEISIDSIDFTDSLYCTFAKSENTYKKGLRCNFSVQQLKTGNHILEVRRKVYDKNEPDSTFVQIYQLPFLKQF